MCTGQRKKPVDSIFNFAINHINNRKVSPKEFSKQSSVLRGTNRRRRIDENIHHHENIAKNFHVSDWKASLVIHVSQQKTISDLYSANQNDGKNQNTICRARASSFSGGSDIDSTQSNPNQSKCTIIIRPPFARPRWASAAAANSLCPAASSSRCCFVVATLSIVSH